MVTNATVKPFEEAKVGAVAPAEAPKVEEAEAEVKTEAPKKRTVRKSKK